MPTWNAQQYLAFADERTQPCRDLVSRIALENGRRIVDLGCGPGNSTQVLGRRWPESSILGLDSSAEMIAAAKRDQPGGDWRLADIATWAADESYDLVFSNAALQWVPDHAVLYPRLMKQVAPGGALAVQVPANLDSPAQLRMHELADSAKWRSHFAQQVQQWFVHDAGSYFDWLAPRSRRIDIWTTEYIHVLPGPNEIVEWYKGTGLRPYLDALPDDTERQEFLRDYLKLITIDYCRRANGQILFPFRRLFLIAYA